MRHQRAGLSLLLVAAGLVLCLGAFLTLAHVRRIVDVIVTSDPPQATVFDGNVRIGATPVSMTLERGRTRSLRLVRKGYEDETLILDAETVMQKPASPRGTTPPGLCAVNVAMRSNKPAALFISSEPASAEVFLDGRRVGVTPLSLTDLDPGAHSLRLLHPSSFTREETIYLEPGKEFRSDYTLNSKVEAFYREEIHKNPLAMTNYAELSHYYVLQGNFAAAERALRDGLAQVGKPEARDADRFFDEVVKTYTHQFIYPKETPDNKIRPACLDIMQTAMDRRLWDSARLRPKFREMRVHDAQGGR